MNDADNDYLDALEDISEGYETELNELSEALKGLDAQRPNSGKQAISVANRIHDLGKRARSMAPSKMFEESHVVFLQGAAEFDEAMNELIAIAGGDPKRAEKGADLVGTHIEQGIRLIEQSTTLLNRLVAD
jgi:hypothetical protein